MTSGPSAREGTLQARAPEMLAVAALAALALAGPTVSAAGTLVADAALGTALLAAAAGGRLVAPRGPLLALFAALAVASSVAAADRGAAVVTVLHGLRVVLAFWLGATLACRAGAATRACRTLAILGAAAAAHGALQVAVIHPRLAEEAQSLGGAVAAQLSDARANSVFLLPAQLGAFLAMTAAAAAGLVLATRGARRAAAAALLAASVAGLALAGSFGGILLTAGALSLVILAAAPARYRRALVGVALVAGIAVGAASLARRAEDVGREGPWTARARNWATALELVREAPVLGHGPGSFAVEHARARPALSNDARHAHEAFLETAAECGVAALVLLAVFVGALAMRCRRALTADDPLRAALAAAAAAAVGQGLIDFGWSVPEWALPAAAVLGLAWTAPAVTGERPASRALVVAGAALAALLAVDAGGALARAAGEDALALGAEGRHEEALVKLQRAEILEPLADRWPADQAGARLALASSAATEAARAGLLARAELDAARAVELSPRKAARRGLLSQVRAARGDVAGAAAEAVRAAELAPQSAEWAAWRDEAVRRLAAGMRP